MLASLQGAGRQDKESALATPEDTHILIMDMLDGCCDKIDKAVDDGNLAVKRLKADEQDAPQVLTSTKSK